MAVLKFFLVASFVVAGVFAEELPRGSRLKKDLLLRSDYISPAFPAAPAIAPAFPAAPAIAPAFPAAPAIAPAFPAAPAIPAVAAPVIPTTRVIPAVHTFPTAYSSSYRIDYPRSIINPGFHSYLY
ncbi:hypothetical protein GE061_017806 [Apolygus lucorum]|uniref:Uncharacterized protein n=1 Tax=Apolygus lucorum TaxID=248454 RepID=A0A6A4IHF8_APOLU|nr:hypothetical protein GE061_017806 [Apolygus lucorum]